MKISVRKHTSIKDLTREAVEQVLNATEKILERACKTAPLWTRAKAKPPVAGRCDIDLEITGTDDPLPMSLSETQEQRLRSFDLGQNAPFDDTKISAAREQLRSGVYNVEAIVALALLSSKESDLVELQIVRSIKCHCDRDPSLPGLWYGGRKAEGCAVINGKLLIVESTPVVRNRKDGLDREWVAEQAGLWAHELSHIVGLRHLVESIPLSQLGQVHKKFPKDVDESSADYWMRLLKGFIMAMQWAQGGLIMTEEWQAWAQYPSDQARQRDIAAAVDEGLASREYLDFLVAAADRYRKSLLRAGRP